jgi:aryl-alcohol dehydrogenase-like predicted oxidoreductase
MIQQSQYRSLGASGILVSPLGTGTNRWEQGKNDAAVFQTFQSLLDAGMNMFDTAEIYRNGKSERLLGECIRQTSQSVVIASKFAPLPTRLSYDQFMHALDASLSRLGLQTIDLYYVHWPFTLLHVETLMDMMARAIAMGKIRAVGVSNFNAAQMRRAAARLARYGISLAANEVHYSLLHRLPETDGVLEACQELNVALVAYCPFERGRLHSSTAPRELLISSLLIQKRKKAMPKQYESLQEILKAIAQQRGKSISQVVLNWLLCKDEHIIPIPGSTSTRHALANADTITWKLTDQEFATIDQASSPWKS